MAALKASSLIIQQIWSDLALMQQVAAVGRKKKGSGEKNGSLKLEDETLQIRVEKTQSDAVQERRRTQVLNTTILERPFEFKYNSFILLVLAQSQTYFQ